MTDREQNVIQCAFNLADAIVAGDYNLPAPMNLAINQLQDAVYGVANERGVNVTNCVSYDFKKYKDQYWKDVENELKRRL